MSIISKVREEAKNHIGELKMMNENPGMSEILLEIMELKEQMNRAKKEAAEIAAKPFQEKIRKLEEDYAFMTKLSI